MDGGNATLRNASKVPESHAIESDKPAIQFCQKGRLIHLGGRRFFEGCLERCFRRDALMTLLLRVRVAVKF